MRIAIVLAAFAVLAAHAVSQASAQTCLRPHWTECVSFPNGGKHTGVDPDGERVEMEVTPGPDICVSLEWEIQAETYAEFSRGGMPWPKRDWDVKVETFCFFKN